MGGWYSKNIDIASFDVPLDAHSINHAILSLREFEKTTLQHESVNLTQFHMLFVDHDEAAKKKRSELFAMFDKNCTGIVNVLEILSACCFFGDGEADLKLECLFRMFDLDEVCILAPNHMY